MRPVRAVLKTVSDQLRKVDDIDKIVNKFYKSYQDEIAMNPEGHAMDYIHIIMDIEKIK